MIRELRKKFILIAMLSTFIVLSAIMGTVNISGYLKMAARADDMTSVLGINDRRRRHRPYYAGSPSGYGEPDPRNGL